jgi:hypothetical protein
MNLHTTSFFFFPFHGFCTGEYRIIQAVDPTRSASSAGSGPSSSTTRPTVRSASTVEPRTVSLDAPNRDPDRSQHRTLSADEEPLRAENGAKMQPVPQRDRGDGLAYTRRVSRP